MITKRERFKRFFHWENWPFDLLYFPISFVWFWYGIKARHFWFFSPVNPTLEFAGFEGGSKREVYKQLPGWSYPTTVYIYPTDKIEAVKDAMTTAGLKFPLVVKPDTGRAGILFRVIQNEEALLHYHSLVGETYLLQEYIAEGKEFTVFHIRYPGNQTGFITGLVVKEFLHITGDGVQTVASLVDAHPVAKFKASLLEKRHNENWKKVLMAGEYFLLNPSGNHNVGTRFVNLNHEIDKRLCEVFNRISKEAGHFYFGRYDLKCTSLEDLKAGKNIRVFEYNGAGAAVVHVFDRGMSYGAALAEIIRHWQHLYHIGRINKKAGVPYLNFIQGWRYMRKAKNNFSRMKKIDRLL